MPFRSTAQQRYMFSQHPGIARRWAEEMKGGKPGSARREHPIRAAHLPNRVGKRMTGGSWESGPSSLVPGVPRGVARRGKTSSTFGGTASHGRRQSFEKALIPADALKAGKQLAQSAGSAGQKLVKPVKQGFQAQRAGFPGAPAGFGGRAGSLAGQATATPMRQAGTAAGAGALAGMGTTSVLQPDQNLVSPPRTQSNGSFGKALVPPDKDRRRELYQRGKEMASLGERTRHGRSMEATRQHGPRPRHYDPELTRQRRVGQAQAATAIGGGAALAAGGRQVLADSKRIKHGIKLGPRSGALVAAGLVGAGATEKLRRYGNDPRSRRWT